MIREARPEDAPALIELERLCPEMGRAAVRIDLRVDHFGLASRYPGSRGYVALADDGSAIIGTVFSSVAPTQLNGRLLPAAYLFSLRVHPSYRRRGVASTLIAHACERALVEVGALTAWAAIVEGNDASLQTAERSGFVRIRDLRAKILLGGLACPDTLSILGRIGACPDTLPIIRRIGAWPHLATRPASLSDLPALADASNRFHARHNFWRPKTSQRLQTELETLRRSPRDIEVALTTEGTALAAASALEVARIARLRLVGLRGLPNLVNRLLSPLFGLFPLNALLVHHYFSPPDQPAVGAALIQALHRRYLPPSWAAIIVVDPLDPVSNALDLLWGISGRVHLVVKGDESIDRSRPSYLP
ncbi:MAG: GNAT family N-acetyltransferase [Chloroflexi bacterium]|nr:GNAT family N-acetyltransferase [Chloroflexota bacterium]